MRFSIKNASFEFLWAKLRQWLQKRNTERLTRLKKHQEQSIAILQKRYGYSKEQATLELKKHYSRARLG